MFPDSITTNQVLTAAEISDTRASALYIASNALSYGRISWQQFIDIANSMIDPALDAQAVYFHAVSAIVNVVKLSTGGA